MQQMFQCPCYSEYRRAYNFVKYSERMQKGNLPFDTDEYDKQLSKLSNIQEKMKNGNKTCQFILFCDKMFENPLLKELAKSRVLR